ncbi:MAG TPA: adenylosuccinate synthase [candidate division Zixibacteria bacterium]|nr:adenylosuccinate synthase [candidate division Zixibacteria bacterium]
MNDKDKCRLVFGLFWGDEGKAKAIDVLDEGVSAVARYQGGANAGHTVHVGDEKYVFHQVPSGIIREGVTGLLGAGMVIDLPELVNEIKALHSRGIDSTGRLLISSRAHLVTPLHKAIDALDEKRFGIGTTLRGIGPTYADKFSRRGIRMGDLIHNKDLQTKTKMLVEYYRPMFDCAGETPPSVDEIIEPLIKSLLFVEDFTGDVSAFIHNLLKSGKSLLIEGAQGGLLDIDWGTYPFVTSSSTALSGVASGLGIDPRRIDTVIGLVKAFTTRVGNGPLPTELDGPEADRLRGTGENDWDEFGATTGRPRRCGWLDGFVLSTNCRRWGVDKLFLTKMDVLDGLDTIKICSAYKLDGRVLRSFPSTIEELERVEPVYEEIDGWDEPCAQFCRWEELPENAKYFVKRIEQFAGCEVGWISTGPARSNVLVKK